MKPEETVSPTRDALREAAFRQGIHSVWTNRRIILGVVALATVLAVGGSLLLPNWYRGEARVLMPESGTGGLATALLGNIGAQAARLLGSSSSDYSRYLAILSSESLAIQVIEEFDLVHVYKKENTKYPLYNTRRMLNKKVSFRVDMQYDYLSVSVLDKDPERAALMANFYVDELNRKNGELASLNARTYRQYVERRYQEVVAALDSSQLSLQKIQEQIGVIELPATAEAFVRGVAEQRAAFVELDIQHQALLQQYGPENPRVIAAREAVRAARRAEQAALGGQDPLLPIQRSDLPAAANQYATAYRDVLLYAELLKAVQPLYEQSRFEEERERMAVEVVDRAYPPERKAEPRRSLIVIGVMLSTLTLSLLVTFLIPSVHSLVQRRIKPRQQV